MKFLLLIAVAIIASSQLVLGAPDMPLRNNLRGHHQNQEEPQQHDNNNNNDKCHSIIADRYPRQYVGFYTPTPPRLDGNIFDDPVWNEVPWTEPFLDLTTDIKPPKLTRAKIRYDDEWLYVAAHLQDDAVWANITYTCHCINASEDQVIFHDNDFEVFLDAGGTTHFYKEYEMNAANQNWNLCLNRPYQNSGYENSSRVFGKHGFDYEFGKHPLRSAVKIEGGALNDPASYPRGWNVEIAFPLSKVVYNTSATLPPKKGVKNMWRINFSRVEWAVKIVNGRYWKEPKCVTCPNPGAATCDNWAFQQIRNPFGAPDIHIPEMWAFLEFSDAAPSLHPQPTYNDEWPARFVAHEVYYANTFFFNKYKHYTDSIPQLLKFAHLPELLSGSCTKTPIIELRDGATKFTATIGSHQVPGMNITVTDTRLTLAHYPN